MAKNDVVVRTAADLEKKYNLASLLGLKKNIKTTEQGIQKVENELNSIINSLTLNLKDVLESQGDVSLWFFSGIPDTTNEPYTLWENPNEHIGDIYYNQSDGTVYQYKESGWVENTSPDLIEAMAITNAEVDTTEDHERKLYFDTPTPPYSNGDWWIKEDGSLFICQISKPYGEEYEKNDFITTNLYTSGINANKVNNRLTVLEETITTIEKTNNNLNIEFEKQQEKLDSLTDELVELREALLDLTYPVGSVYIGLNDTNPNLLFGGTWEQIKDRFLLSAGDNYEVGSTGGEASHTLSINELPKEVWHSAESSDGVATLFNNGSAYGIRTQQSSLGQAHNNMPPYLAVYMWKRIS